MRKCLPKIAHARTENPLKIQTEKQLIENAIQFDRKP